MQFISDLPFGSLLVIAILGGAAVWRYRGGKKQFTLRGMLLGMFLVTLPLAWFAQGMREYLREQRAIAGLREAGIDVRTDTFRRPLESFFFGKRWQQRAFAVYADKSLVTRRELELMGELPFVSTIRIHQGDFSDDDLRTLAGLPRLRELTLFQSPITGAGLAHLSAELPMERLELSFCPIDDAAMQHVARWKKLYRIHLDGTQITDVSLEFLSELPHLKNLLLDHTAITDAGVRRHESLFLKCSCITVNNTELTKEVAKWIHHAGNWTHAPTPAHRRATVKLLLQGINVHMANDAGTSCWVSFNRGWKESERTADLLRQLCPIRSVNFRASKPSGSAIHVLAGLKELQGIRIEGPAIPAHEFEEFANQNHPDLRTIIIEQCAYSPQSISGLARFRSLEDLVLDQMRVDEGAISHFAGFRKVEHIDFRDSHISDEAAFQLQVLLPFTFVSYGTKNAQASQRERRPNWDELGTPKLERDNLESLMAVGMAFDTPNRKGQFRHARGTEYDFDLVIPDLCKLTAIESLELRYQRVTPPRLEQLRALNHLRHLTISTNDFRGWDLTFIRDLPNLQKLSLQGRSLQEVLQQLDGGVPSLLTLELNSQDAQNSWLSHLPNGDKLESLRINVQRQESLDLSPLTRLARLRILGIGYGKFSDVHLASLAPLTTLQSLDLYSTAITDASVDLLAKRTNLRRLNVTNTKLTKEGVGKLRAALPLTQIEATYPPPGPVSR